MKKLETILSTFSVDGQLGGKRAFDREYLRTALATSSRQTSVAFWLAVCAQFALFLLAAWFALNNAANAKAVSAILAGAGGGVGTCAYAMVRLWKQKVATDLTLGLVSSLDDAAAVTVLNVVLDILRGESKTVTARTPRVRRPAGAA